ncbi:hypothetical protein DE146DRAFT_787173 [Phaeosphaeria sp. MPI-PUGE-AT-0046c]|nr:hypothetical protein DE146DRAFT_787173 [Phaeosphaeria sp. MPI-PUGE-AT-0046c]
MTGSGMSKAHDGAGGRYTAVSLHDHKNDVALQTLQVAGPNEHHGDYPSAHALEKPDLSSSKPLGIHTGWRRGILYCICTALVVLAFSLVFMGWAMTRTMEGSNLPVLYRGNCKSSRNISTAAHVAINVLSTLLLGASNYCMHIASAPSRHDINMFHSKKRVLDIGLNSVSNMFKLGWDRRIVWCILGLSSIPLHLMFNSVVYATTTAYEYYAAVVTDDFFQGANWTTSTLSQTANHVVLSAEWLTWLEDAHKGRPQQVREIQLTKLDNKACIQTYTTPFVTQNGNLILTVDHQNTNTSNYFNSSLLTVSQAGYRSGTDKDSHAYTSYGWMCAKNAFEAGWDTSYLQRCDAILSDPSSFTLYEGIPVESNSTSRSLGYQYINRALPITACYTQTKEESCTVKASVTLLGIVIVFITCKTLCMLWILWRLKESPLAVLGDAIASFITQPDDHTKDACLATPSAFTHTKTWQVKRAWSSKPKRWMSNVSGGQWITCILMCIAALGIAIYLLGSALVTVGHTNAPFKASGFNTIHPTFMLFDIVRLTGNSASSLLPAVLLANLPQLVVSLIYVSYNSVWTSMLMGLEWSQYALKRKVLRVSYPTQPQRSTYRLQIPYRYGVPLMVLIGSTHFLISESIFVVQLRVMALSGQEDPEQSFVTCGYSMLALLVTMVVGAVAVLAIIGFGLRRYEPGMILVKCSSAAISAACHPRADEDSDAALQPLQWGAVLTEQTVGHCCFSTDTVLMPEEGREYM